MKKSIFILIISIFCMSESCAVKKENKSIVCFETNYGKITVKLYEETPKHRANFLKLVNDGFYNGVLFHRVIAEFMIQAGDPDSKDAKSGKSLGSGDVGYTIPAEFVYPTYYHKRGVLSAARQGDESNPKKASSGCQFYIVEGRTFTDKELDSLDKSNERKQEEKLFQEILKSHQDEVKRYRMERSQPKLDALRDSILADVHDQMLKNPTYKLTEQQRNDYKTLGGTPHLDGEYTVFGEVIEGLDVVSKISKAKTGRNDRPVEDIKVLKASCE